MHSDTPIASYTNPTEQSSFFSGLFGLLGWGTHLHLGYNEHLVAQESDDLIYECYVLIG